MFIAPDSVGPVGEDRLSNIPGLYSADWCLTHFLLNAIGGCLALLASRCEARRLDLRSGFLFLSDIHHCQGTSRLASPLCRMATSLSGRMGPLHCRSGRNADGRPRCWCQPPWAHRNRQKPVARAAAPKPSEGGARVEGAYHGICASAVSISAYALPPCRRHHERHLGVTASSLPCATDWPPACGAGAATLVRTLPSTYSDRRAAVPGADPAPVSPLYWADGITRCTDSAWPDRYAPMQITSPRRLCGSHHVGVDLIVSFCSGRGGAIGRRPALNWTRTAAHQYLSPPPAYSPAFRADLRPSGSASGCAREDFADTGITCSGAAGLRLAVRQTLDILRPRKISSEAFLISR